MSMMMMAVGQREHLRIVCKLFLKVNRFEDRIGQIFAGAGLKMHTTLIFGRGSNWLAA
jgi:hypothetical protein